MSLIPLYRQQLVQEASFKRALGKKAPGNVDYFIASYPRSGNTWMRYLVVTYLLKQKGFVVDDKLPIHPDAIIPDIHANELGVKPVFDFPLRVVKSHAKESPDFVTRMNYIFRDPADCLTSFYHYHLRYKKLREIVDGITIDQFCTIYLNDWIQNVMYSIEESKRKEMLFVSYEFMHSKTLIALNCVLNDIGVVFDESVAKFAVEFNEFSRFHKHDAETLTAEHQGECFYRKGKVGSAAEELRPETIAYIKEYAADVYDQAVLLQRQSIVRALS